KQKVLAAHRAGLKEVILPQRNEGDLDDVPEQVRNEIKFHLVDTVDQALAIALQAAGTDVPATDPDEVAA
ncbi:MAG TPA: S16 family serine protease, partial [Actinomycetota bacterium]|nr:S16 family serine protease [Actinomycetota bacterium]